MSWDSEAGAPTETTAQSGGDLPMVLTACLTIRVGESHASARGGWKRDIMFDVAEGYDVFRAKCIARFNELAVSAEVTKKKKRLQLRNDSDVYLKRSSNENQDKYMRLSTTNFKDSLHHRWKLLKPSDRAAGSTFKFLAFLYVENTASLSTSTDFHRATEKRVQQARLQWLAHEAANDISFGPIMSHHLDIANACRPDAAAFYVPEDNTTAQARELDRQREELELQRTQEEIVARAQTATIKLQWSGVWIPVEVDVVSLRRAIGLPDHNIFTSGIYHDFTPRPPSQPNLEDMDHKEDDDSGDEEVGQSGERRDQAEAMEVTESGEGMGIGFAL